MASWEGRKVEGRKIMSWQAIWVSVAHKVSSQSDTSNRHVAWRLRPRAFVACGIPVSLRPRSFPAFGASGWRGRCFGLALIQS